MTLPVFPGLSPGSYDALVADPPWSFLTYSGSHTTPLTIVCLIRWHGGAGSPRQARNRAVGVGRPRRGRLTRLPGRARRPGPGHATACHHRWRAGPGGDAGGVVAGAASPAPHGAQAPTARLAHALKKLHEYRRFLRALSLNRQGHGHQAMTSSAPILPT